MTEDKSRTLRAILRTAALWSAAWALAGGGIMATLTLINPGPGVESLVERLGVAVFAGISWGVRFGLAGAVIGAAFSTVIRLGYKGRRLADIDPVRFGLLGAVVGGVGVPFYLQAMNVLTGGHLIAVETGHRRRRVGIGVRRRRGRRIHPAGASRRCPAARSAARAARRWRRRGDSGCRRRDHAFEVQVEPPRPFDIM